MLAVLLMMICTALCMKVLIVKLTVISRSLEKKINCMLLGIYVHGFELIAMTKVTLNLKFVLLVCAFRGNVYLVAR